MKEIIARFISKTPKFFKVLQLIGAILAAITGLPALLEAQGVAIPESITLSPVWAAIGTASGIITMIISQFVVDTPRATENVINKIENGVNPEVASKSA